jgi:predicted DNA binding CopG/RHH family protein
MPDNGVITSEGASEESDMPRRTMSMPKFKTEREEADWWASAAGRSYVKRRSKADQANGLKPTGSRLVAQLNKKKTTQIAIRLPDTDIQEARRIADRKGIGYQTLLKMLLHEGLRREIRRG